MMKRCDTSGFDRAKLGKQEAPAVRLWDPVRRPFFIPMASAGMLIGMLAVSAMSLAGEARQEEATVFRGERATQEVREFLAKRWNRQKWQIECRKLEEFPEAKPVWFVRGTEFFVRLDGPEIFEGHLDLAKLDPGRVYEVVGVPVDQNFGAITLYVLSEPEAVQEVPEAAKGANDR